jgi:hypothetical protein
MFPILKSSYILIYVLLFCSCSSQKELYSKALLTCKGIIHLSENGCPFYLEITQSTMDEIPVGSKIFPVELKDSYKKKGLNLAFNAVLSKAPSPKDCKIDGVASLSDVVVIP